MAGKRGRKRQQKKQRQQDALDARSDATSEPAGQDADDYAGKDADDEAGDDLADDAPDAKGDAPPLPVTTSPAEAAAPVPTPLAVASVEPDAKSSGAAPPLDVTAPASWPQSLAACLEEQLKLTSAYIYTLIAAVVFCVYANSMSVPFLFDDAPVITRERLFHELSFENLWAIILHYKLRLIPTLTFYLNYHIQGTPAYQYGSGPWEGTYGPTYTYHAFNMALHAVNGILLYLFLKTLLSGSATPVARATAVRRLAQKNGGNPIAVAVQDAAAPLAEWIALGATLLWLVHPIQTMAVTYITQRHALMGAMGIFGSLWCYVALRRRMESGTAWLRANKMTSYAFAFGVLGFWVYGCLSKENGAIVPWVIPLIEWIFFSRTVPAGSSSLLDDVLGERNGRWALAFMLVPFFFFAIFYRYTQVGIDQLFPSSAPTFPDRMSYFRTEWVVTLKYLRLFALPTDLSAEQAFPGLSWSDAAHPDYSTYMVMALIAHALIVSLGVIWYRSGRKFLAFCVAWYYMMLAVESSFIPILDPMVDHRMYVPSAFLAAGLAYIVATGAASIWTYGADWVTGFARRFAGIAEGAESVVASALEPVRQDVYEKRHSISLGFLFAWGALLIVASIGTHIRNRAWGDHEHPYRIWEDVIAKRPDCARAYSSLGMEMLYKGRWIESVEPIETALYLGPYHVEGWNNIGKAYLELGSNMPNIKNADPKKASIEPNKLLVFAKETLEQGIEVNRVAPSPSVPLCWNNLGLTYLKMSERLGKSNPKEVMRLEREAAVALSEAVKLDPGYETAWINLGTTYVRQAELAQTPEERKSLALQAVDALHNSGTLKPQHQLFSIAAMNCALADRMAERHAEAFALFSALVDGENGSAVQREYREEAGFMADEMATLPGQLARLENSIGLAQSPAEKKQLIDAQKDLKRELADCKNYAPGLVQAGLKYVAEGEKLAPQDAKGAVQYFRFGGTLLFGAGEVQRALAAYDRAIQLAEGDEKDKVERERANLLAMPAH